MPSFAKVITIAVAFLPLASATSCDAGDTSCESRAREETTSLLQTKSVVQHGTPAKEEHVHDLGLASSHSNRKKNEDACAKKNGIFAGEVGATTCFCPLGYDCADEAGKLNMVNPARLVGWSTKCKWSPPDNTALEKVMDKRANPDWGQWYFDHSSCTTCYCFDQFKTERELSPVAPAEQQVASLANLVYQNVGCPESSKAARATLWTTKAGWKLASYDDERGNHAVCKNTRDDEQFYSWSWNSTKTNAAAHDNFALFINSAPDQRSGLQPKTCVLAIEGTTFNGVKNWLNDATLVSSPWCGMNVQAGFKAEIMQFVGNWSISENEPLIGKPTWSPHYSQEQFNADQKFTELSNSQDSIIDELTKVVKSDCNELWVTGHSLGGAMAEMFAMCWNKVSVAEVPKVSKVFTFGAPSAFDPFLIPPAKDGRYYSAPAVGAAGNVAVDTTWDTCFGGKRFYNMGTDVNTAFDPVPTVATELGWMHLPYEAEQLGPADQGRHVTECSNCDLLGLPQNCKVGTGKGPRNERKVPEDCPVCMIPTIPGASLWNTTKRAAVATATAAAAAAAVVGVVAAIPVVVGAATAGTVASVAGGVAVRAGAVMATSGEAGKVGTYETNGASMHSMGVYVERLGRDYYTSR